MPTAMLEEQIVDITLRLNQAVRQQFARTLSDVTKKFQWPD